MKVFVESTSAADDCEAHVLGCISNSIRAHGGLLVDGPGADVVSFSLHHGVEDQVHPGKHVILLSYPWGVPSHWVPKLANYDLILHTSAHVVAALNQQLPYGPPVRQVQLPIDLDVLVEDRRAHWLTWDDANYRLYAIVRSTEVGLFFPLLRAYMEEYRATDKVSLTLLLCGSVDQSFVDTVAREARSQSGLSQNRCPKITAIRDVMWSSSLQGSLHAWGDCCVLPWSGSLLPVEATYALAAGNLLIATGWFVDGLVTSSSGIALGYAVLEVEQGYNAVPAWQQLQETMRLAVANGRRVMHPARKLGERLDYRRLNFLRNLMSIGGRRDN